MKSATLCFVTIGASILAACPILLAQGTLADYQRARELQAKARGLVVNSPGPITWIGDTDHFWYPRSVKGGTEIVLVNADARTKKLAFDHQKMAAAISKATGHTYTALALPFATQPRPGGRPVPPGTTAPLTFVDDEKNITFGTGGFLYKCSLSEYSCNKEGPIPAPGPAIATYREMVLFLIRRRWVAIR